MKRIIVPTLAAMAALPTLSAVTIEEGDVKLKLGGRIQARAEYATGTKSDGADWYPSGGETEELDFSLRRIRFTASGSYADWVKFKVDFEADKAGAERF